MKRTLALTTALALSSLGVTAYARTTPTDHGQPQTQTAKKHKKDKKQNKSKTTHEAAKK